MVKYRPWGTFEEKVKGSHGPYGHFAQEGSAKYKKIGPDLARKKQRYILVSEAEDLELQHRPKDKV